LQTHESADVSDSADLLALLRYESNGKIDEDFCSTNHSQPIAYNTGEIVS
jgi:hypothetical protein